MMFWPTLFSLLIFQSKVWRSWCHRSLIFHLLERHGHSWWGKLRLWVSSEDRLFMDFSCLTIHIQKYQDMFLYGSHNCPYNTPETDGSSFPICSTHDVQIHQKSNKYIKLKIWCKLIQVLVKRLMFNGCVWNEWHEHNLCVACACLKSANME